VRTADESANNPLARCFLLDDKVSVRFYAAIRKNWNDVLVCTDCVIEMV
jgi:ferric iron reductase protein FhuF